MSRSRQPTLFVVDDNPAVRESVLALARSRGLDAQGFESAEAFLEVLDRPPVGCLVVDVRLTGMSGLDLQSCLRGMGYTLPVIVITAYADVPMAVRAMQEGAVSLLEKPPGSDELWAAIEQALRQDELKQRRKRQREATSRRIAQLSEEEQEILRRIMRGQPNKKIASQMAMGLRTVELRRSHIMKTLQADTLAELIRIAVVAEFPVDDSERPPPYITAK